MYVRNYNKPPASGQGQRIPVQSFPEPGVFMGMEKNGYEEQTDTKPRLQGSFLPNRSMTTSVSHTPQSSKRFNDAAESHTVSASLESDSASDDKFTDTADENAAQASDFHDDQQPDEDFSREAHRSSVPVSARSKNDTGLIDRLGKSLSKYSGGILSEFSAEDLIIIAIIALFLLGTDNDDPHGANERDNLVPLVLLALVLF